MKTNFQQWLLIFMIIAFFLTFSLAYMIQTETAQENALHLIALKIDDAKKQVQGGHIAHGLRIGNDGRVIICDGGKIVGTGKADYRGKNITELGIAAEYLATSESFLVVIDGEQCIGKAERFGRYDFVGILPLAEVYQSRDNLSILFILGDLVIFWIIFVVLSQLIQRFVIDGIDEINHSLEIITQGDLDEVVDVRKNPELSTLSDGVNAMVHALRQSNEKEKKRIRRELEFARAIQISSLPTIFPPFPERTDLELFARMDTARAVGGDFYDFFFINENELILMIADVAGKGIPAALYMMDAKALIKGLGDSGMGLSAIFQRANEMLCKKSAKGMFMTAWLGAIDFETGLLRFVSAGHVPPMLKSQGGEYQALKYKTGFVLGGMEGVEYPIHERQLAEGDILLLYTDGVTEATDPEENMFGEAQLAEILAESENIAMADLLQYIKNQVDLFADGSEQADDITMMAVQFLRFGRGKTSLGK